MFKLHSKYKPAGDQKTAIKSLVSGLEKGLPRQTLLGVTGSGKTFTMANIIEQTQKPTLILAHNKTLAAQLAQEFSEFFPENEVHYFVSYYDYYQPEAYIQKTDTYIEKDSSINEEIDRLRHAATESLLSKKDVIIVASVSCIYGIGNISEYQSAVFQLETGKDYVIEEIIEHLVSLQFTRAASDFSSGMFRVMGDMLEIFPASREYIYTCEFFGNFLEKITIRQLITGRVLEEKKVIEIFPAKHTVTSSDTIKRIAPLIQEELTEREEYFQKKGNLIAAERIRTKTEFDLEMMQEVGYVKGIENYSRYLDGREVGNPSQTLIDYFGDDYLMFVDESHITLPQIRGMYAGDRARKDMLIEHGFRLPSAYDNRPLYFEEFESRISQVIAVSATPGESPIETSGPCVEQVIRPTGLLDPVIDVEDMEYLVDSLLANVDEVIARNERALITTVTKKSSEDLAKYFVENGYKSRYLHSEIDTVERLEILRDLRLGVIDVLVGVNLLREGLDLPEVSFIGIVDAHKQGFLRSTKSLIQIIGRAARNVRGRVVMYSYKKQLSQAMEESITITNNRRIVQETHNIKHGITPQTVISSIKEVGMSSSTPVELPEGLSVAQQKKKLELDMDIAVAQLDFEKAAQIRDTLLILKSKK